MSNENITAIRKFLTYGELRITRGITIFQIVSLDDNGIAEVIQNPITSRQGVSIRLEDEEIASLASICFSPKKEQEDGSGKET